VHISGVTCQIFIRAKKFLTAFVEKMQQSCPEASMSNTLVTAYRILIKKWQIRGASYKLKCKSGENEIMNQCKCGIGVLIDKRTNHK
jgi:hypothetical protein